jgi:hypothetical protein
VRRAREGAAVSAEVEMRRALYVAIAARAEIAERETEAERVEAERSWEADVEQAALAFARSMEVRQ